MPSFRQHGLVPPTSQQGKRAGRMLPSGQHEILCLVCDERVVLRQLRALGDGAGCINPSLRQINGMHLSSPA